MHFYKYHGLGNDYLVLDPATSVTALTPEQIRLICHRNYGLGSDGILLGPLEHPQGDFGLRLFNPDGSEFEKSGNGLRIFARYLWDRGLVGLEAFTIATPGGVVTARVHRGGRRVTVEMGPVTFCSSAVPVTGPTREVINETIEIQGRKVQFCAASIGNPHCVVLQQSVSPEQARAWGPLIENDRRFPNRTNVQLVEVIDRSRIRIEIWERGVGYTLASGSSSCAAAAVAHRLDLCEREIEVIMPGGRIAISIADDWSVTMSGAVTKICAGTMSSEMFSQDNQTHVLP